MVEYITICNINRKICKGFWQCIMTDYKFICDVSGLVLVLQATPFAENVAGETSLVQLRAKVPLKCHNYSSAYTYHHCQNSSQILGKKMVTITLLSIRCYSCVYILWTVHLEHWVVQCNHQIVLRGPLWSTIERIINDGFDKAPNPLPLLAAKKEEVEIDKGYGMAFPQPLVQSIEHLSVKQNRYSVVIKRKKQLLSHTYALQDM